LRLRTWQEGAEAEREQKPLLTDPAPLLDQHPLHNCDLPGRPAERLQGHQEPGPGGLPEWDDIRAVPARTSGLLSVHGNSLPSALGHGALCPLIGKTAHVSGMSVAGASQSSARILLRWSTFETGGSRAENRRGRGSRQPH
jgi:hypothetical protein